MLLTWNESGYCGNPPTASSSSVRLGTVPAPENTTAPPQCAPHFAKIAGDGTPATIGSSWDSPVAVRARDRAVRQWFGYETKWSTLSDRIALKTLGGTTLQPPPADIKTSISKLLGSEVRIAETYNGVRYRSPLSEFEIEEDALTQTFSVLKNGSPADLNGNFMPLGENIFRYGPGLIDRPHENLGASLYFLRAKARGLVEFYTGDKESVSRRVERFSKTWNEKTLGQGIGRFVGTKMDNLVLKDEGYKVRIENSRSGFTIIDDPEGQYFRVIKKIDGLDRYVDWNGNAADTTAAGQASSHFYYGNKETTRPTFDSFLAQARMRRVRNGRDANPLRSDSKPEPVKEEAISALPTKEQIEPSAGILNDLSSLDPKLRVAAINNLDWKKLSPEQQDAVLRHADKEIFNSYEIGALIELAIRSKDARWKDFLFTIVTKFESYESGWQKYKYKEAKAVLDMLNARQ